MSAPSPAGSTVRDAPPLSRLRSKHLLSAFVGWFGQET